MTSQVYRQLAQRLAQGRVAVATVIQTTGSVPREVGAKLLVWATGECWGTIGGGAGEAKVIEYAYQALTTGRSGWVEIDLSGAPQRQTQGVCGGCMQVWVSCWEPASGIPLVETILANLATGQAACLVTPLGTDQPPLLRSQPIPPQPTIEGNTFVEPLRSPPALLIIGAGHVAVPLAQVAALTGFQIMVQDDRPAFANAQRFPTASQIFTQSIAASLPDLATISDLYVALVTRGYQYDLDALPILLQRSPPCRYLGMIGSQKRVRQVIQHITQTLPNLTPAQLAPLHAPIGLDIGALTPEEIAISICAELIQVYRGGSGLPLSAGQP